MAEKEGPRTISQSTHDNLKPGGKWHKPSASELVDGIQETPMERTPETWDVYRNKDDNAPEYFLAMWRKGDIWQGHYFSRDDETREYEWQESNISEESLLKDFTLFGNALRCVELCAGLGDKSRERFAELEEAKRSSEERDAYHERAMRLASHQITTQAKNFMAAAQRYAALVEALESICGVWSGYFEGGAHWECADNVRHILAAHPAPAKADFVDAGPLRELVKTWIAEKVRGAQACSMFCSRTYGECSNELGAYLMRQGKHKPPEASAPDEVKSHD